VVHPEEDPAMGTDAPCGLCSEWGKKKKGDWTTPKQQGKEKPKGRGDVGGCRLNCMEPTKVRETTEGGRLEVFGSDDGDKGFLSHP